MINVLGVFMLSAFAGMSLACLDPIKREAYPRWLRLQLLWVWAPILFMVTY